LDKKNTFGEEILRIAIDLDGVLADASKIWIRLLKQRFEITIKKEDVNEWDLYRKLGISRKEFEDVFNDAWKEWELVEETEENLFQKINLIKNLGKTDLVTARNQKTMNDVMKWLEEKKIKFDNIIVVGEFESKAKLDYDIFIDDSPIQITEMANSGKLSLLYMQPWNDDIKERNNLIKIKNFEEVEKVIKNYTRNE
jgi:uncharacterized HAD superfamily protein|tara:strand:- start:14729 stop:15319 length:591 start_codon:yes stop_codon:yes gene_type:complete